MANLPMPQQLPMTNVAFTRYLYDKTEVLHSLLFALLNHNRDEALFWAYELYFSGFEIELAEWLRWTYLTFYSEVDKWVFEFIEINLRRLHTLPDKEERDCIIGTVVSNLAHRYYDIQAFVSQYMGLSFDRITPEIRNHRIYIQFRPRDLAKYLTCEDATILARNYLKEVSKYPIRKSESIFLRKYVCASNECVVTEDTEIPYLSNWLYYAAESPIWKCRIAEYGGLVNHTESLVVFENDEQSELFYAKYGYEPDEQSLETHLIHGIDSIQHCKVFAEQCPHEFVFNYSNGRISKYSAI